ncbi:MAG: radical SAM protein [Candidatus Omnitrophica bacterium]|nr:radical SAM protein [Candidatus Omnitrophota bacterium]
MKLLRRNYAVAELLILRKNLLKLLFSPKKIINFLLVKFSVFFKLKKCLGLPLNILIEPTGRCNYRCLKCEMFSKKYRDEEVLNKNKNMPKKYYKKIIDELGDSLLTLRLWHYGEPLLNPDIFWMVEYAKRKSIIVAISSNLSLLRKEKPRKLIASGLDYLIVSFDGASERSYNLYHRKDNFNQVAENIIKLVKLKKELKSLTPFIELQFIMMKENEKEITRMKNLAKEWGVNKLTFLKLDVQNINFDKIEGFNSKKDILPANKNYWLDLEGANQNNFCKIPWEETLIRYSGIVLPCAVDLSQEYRMGRLFGENYYLGFNRLWNNHNYRTFRKTVSKHDKSCPEICRNCGKRNNTSSNEIKL